MAYDNKNHYPEKTKGAQISAGRVTSGSLSEKCLSWMGKLKKDMSKLQDDRAEAHRYYMGEKLGNEVEGRSQVIMSTVQDKVESLMPSMMRIFYGGAEVLNVKPVGPEDVMKARLMEQKVNHDIQRGIDGFGLIYKFIKDALLYKMGVVKYYWLNKTEWTPGEEENLDEGGMMRLMSDPNIEIDSVTYHGLMDNGKVVSKNKPIMDEGLVSVTYSIKYRTGKKISKPMAENVAPEDFIFNIWGKDLNDFCAHRVRIHKNKLKSEYGVSDDELRQLEEDMEMDTTFTERFADLGGRFFFKDTVDVDYYFIYECYLNEVDSDGNENPKVVTMFGDKALRIEDNSYGKPCFCVMSPIIISHRVCGRSIAELLLELQKIETVLMRYVLDNVYFQNNGMRVVNPYRIDVDSLISGNRPGGVVFTKYDINPSEGIFPVPINPLPNWIMDVMEKVDTITENRTGVTKYNQGLDSKTLNKTATGITAIMTAAQQRIELIARIFAETGIKDLYTAFVKMNIDYFDIEQALLINNEWIMVDPADISGEFDVYIDVGVGVGSREMAYQQKVQMLNMYAMAAQLLGPAAPMLFSIDNIKNVFKGMWEDLGYKNVGEYLNMTGGMNGLAGQPPAAGLPQQGGQGINGAPPPPGILSGGGIPNLPGIMGMPPGGQ